MEKYELIRSNRKTIAIQIRGDGQVMNQMGDCNEHY